MNSGISESFYKRLIEAVQEQKVLYAKEEDGYTDKLAKQNAWTCVSLKLGKPADECEKRWLLLREKYARETRKMELASESDTPKEMLWPLLESMSFLKGYIKRRKRSSGKILRNEMLEASTSTSKYFKHCDEELEASTSTPKYFKHCDDTIMIPPRLRTYVDDESSCSEAPKRSKLSEEPSLSPAELSKKFSMVLDAYKAKVLPNEQSEDELFMRTAVKMMDRLPIIVKDRIKSDFFKMITAERRAYFSKK